jgi:hypothetical protein
VQTDKGISNFGQLQNWRSEADGELVFYIFRSPLVRWKKPDEYAPDRKAGNFKRGAALSMMKVSG